MIHGKYYTLIGSRKTSADDLALLTKAAKCLHQDGWIGRSGGADGVDSCLEKAFNGVLENCNIYLPWEGFNGKSSNNRGYINSKCLPKYKAAAEIAKRVHPHWSSCSNGAKLLHTRNVFQILGSDLGTPSKFVLCWAPTIDNIGNVKGGTGTAVRLALEYSIPVYNLVNESDKRKVLKYLEDK